MTPFLQDATSYANVSHERLSYSYLWLSYKKSEIVITARAIGGIMKLEENVGVYLCHTKGRVVLEAVDGKTLPAAGQALVKKLIVEKVGREFRAKIDESADHIPNGVNPKNKPQAQNQAESKKFLPKKTFEKSLPPKKEIIKHIVKQVPKISAKRISKYQKKDEKKNS